MLNKLKSNFTSNDIEVLTRVQNYPQILKIARHQLNYLSQLNQFPQVEELHPIIQWLYHYCHRCEQWLSEMEQVLTRIQSSQFPNKQKLLKKLGTAKDKSNFRSTKSELFLANFLIKNGIDLLEFEPKGKDGEKRTDFKISLGSTDVAVELITPNPPNNDFIEKQNLLIEKLMRIESGLSIEVCGFELYDSANLWRTRVEPPLRKHIDEIVNKFIEYVKYISDNKLPKELPTLCRDYPRIKIIVNERIPNYKYTVVASGASRTGEGFPIYRIINKISEESKHLSSCDFNFVIVDFSYWSLIEWHYLDSPIHREILSNEMKKNMSSRIDGVFSYIISNQNDERLIQRRILYLNSNKPFMIQSEMQKFLKIWESEN